MKKKNNFFMVIQKIFFTNSYNGWSFMMKTIFWCDWFLGKKNLERSDVWQRGRTWEIYE